MRAKLRYNRLKSKTAKGKRVNMRKDLFQTSRGFELYEKYSH